MRRPVPMASLVQGACLHGDALDFLSEVRDQMNARRLRTYTHDGLIELIEAARIESNADLATALHATDALVRFYHDAHSLGDAPSIYYSGFLHGAIIMLQCEGKRR